MNFSFPILKKIVKFTFTSGMITSIYFISFKTENKYFRMAYAGLIAQILPDILFHPIDLINIRTKYHYTQNINALKMTNDIYTSHGVPGFFRGISITMISSVFIGSIYYFFYKYLRDYFIKICDNRTNLYFLAYFFSSFLSEAASYFFYHPFDFIKTRITSGQYDYKNLVDAFRKIFYNVNYFEGIKTLYTAFSIGIFIGLSNTSLGFLAFEMCRDHYSSKKGIKSSEVSGFDYFKSCFIAGVLSSLVLNYFETYYVQKVVKGKNYSFKTFIKSKNFMNAFTSGILAKNFIQVFYMILHLEFVGYFSKIYGVEF